MAVNKKLEIIQELIQMRIKKSLPIYDMVEYVKNTYGYEQSYAYDCVREARKQIAEVYKEWNINALEEAISDLEEQKKEAGDDKKLALDITKEINKIKGLYTERIDLNIIDFKAKFPGQND